jgi:hypothetical protein
MEAELGNANENKAKQNDFVAAIGDRGLQKSDVIPPSPP